MPRSFVAATRGTSRFKSSHLVSTTKDTTGAVPSVVAELLFGANKIAWVQIKNGAGTRVTYALPFYKPAEDNAVAIKKYVAFLQSAPALAAHIAALPPLRRDNALLRSIAALHEEASTLYASNRAEHNALIDLAWAKRKTP